MRDYRRRKHRRRRRRLFTLLVAVVLLCAAFGALLYMESHQRVQARGVPTQDIGLLRRMTFEGQTYVEKSDITTILLMGIDREAGDVRYGARQGGQADFQVLLVLDHGKKQIHQLHIDRDTMTGVDALGVLGNPLGVQTMQICLAHAFGATAEENALNVKAAVERLLEGLEVDYYISMELEAIAALNSLLGGVRLTLEEDYAYIDPAMTKGVTLTLTDEQAYNLVKRRLDVGDGTNEARMRRQQAFIDAAFSQLQHKLSQTPVWATDVFEQLQPLMTTNMPQGRMAAEINRAYRYDALPARELAGEHTIGKDGFVEFHVDDKEAKRWVVNTLFNQNHESN